MKSNQGKRKILHQGRERFATNGLRTRGLLEGLGGCVRAGAASWPADGGKGCSTSPGTQGLAMGIVQFWGPSTKRQWA